MTNNLKGSGGKENLNKEELIDWLISRCREENNNRMDTHSYPKIRAFEEVLKKLGSDFNAEEDWRIRTNYYEKEKARKEWGRTHEIVICASPRGYSSEVRKCPPKW